jgi:hypothetical protein
MYEEIWKLTLSTSSSCLSTSFSVVPQHELKVKTPHRERAIKLFDTSPDFLGASVVVILSMFI